LFKRHSRRLDAVERAAKMDPDDPWISLRLASMYGSSLGAATRRERRPDACLLRIFVSDGSGKDLFTATHPFFQKFIPHRVTINDPTLRSLNKKAWHCDKTWYVRAHWEVAKKKPRPKGEAFSFDAWQ